MVSFVIVPGIGESCWKHWEGLGKFSIFFGDFNLFLIFGGVVGPYGGEGRLGRLGGPLGRGGPLGFRV